MNYYFEREVKHLEYVQQRKSIREQEKTDMALELARKKAVSEISETRVAFLSHQWESVSRLIPRESCVLHGLMLWASRVHFFDFLTMSESCLLHG